MRVPASASWLTFALVFPGCFSASSAAPPGEEPSDAATATVDATAPVEAAVPADASGPREAAPEAALPEAAVEAGPQPVTVTIVNHLGPEPGVLVVFQDASGNVVTAATTDALGRVSQLVASGSQVTAVMGSTDPGLAGSALVAPPANVQLVTVQGVEPGDALSLVDPSDTTFARATVSVDALPDAAPPPGTVAVDFQVGRCTVDGVPPPVQLGISQECQANGTFPLLAIAVGGADAGYGDLGYTWQEGNLIPDDGGTAHVTMSGPWSTSVTTQSLAATNVAAAVNNPIGSYTEIVGGVGSSSTLELSMDDGGGVAAFAGHPAFATVVQNEVMTYAHSSSAGLSFFDVTSIATRGPFSADAGATFDMSTALPFINYVAMDGGDAPADSGLPSQPYAAWSSDAGSLASLSGVVIQFSWSSNSGGVYTPGTWTIVAPPTATSVTAPMLPPQVAGWTMHGGYYNLPPLVVAVQASFLPNYAAFRGQFATLPATPAFVSESFYQGPIVPPLPVNGTVRFSGVTTLGS